MKGSYVLIASLLLALFTASLINCANKQIDHKKLKQLLKNNKPTYKQGACSEFSGEIKPTEMKRKFMPIKIDKHHHSSSSSSNQVSPQYDHLSSIRAVEAAHDIFDKQCFNESVYGEYSKQFYEITWRYKFFESLHCIRVELDFGNLTHFFNLFGYKYYKFSYRELGLKNSYSKRNLITDQTNSLTIHRVNIRPYVVCVTFYKKNVNSMFESSIAAETSSNSTNNNSTVVTATAADESVRLTCEQVHGELISDERMHDADMCVDVDTQAHFLGHITDMEEANHEETTDRELLMVLFIIVLLVALMAIITFTHYLIEKPKKRKMLSALRDYIVKKSHGPGYHTSSHSSLNKDNKGGPSILITDFSSTTSLSGHHMSSTHLVPHEEAKESDTLLPPTANATCTRAIEPIGVNLHNSVFTPVTANVADPTGGMHKVLFHIGETIIEEPSGSSEKSLSGLDNNEECIKSISHLLDDKPWLTSTPSQANMGTNTRSNSLAAQGTNSS
jgi:hypothetical protein